MDLEQYAFVMAQVTFATEAERPGVLQRLQMTAEGIAQLQAIWKSRLNSLQLSIQYATALERHKKDIEARRAKRGPQ